MSENRDVFEFLSKCWVPFIVSEQRVYYACGNTQMHDFLRDFKVSSEMDILVLGLGDVRHVMATVAGLSQRPPSSAGEVKEMRFHLNDVDQDVIARDIIILEFMNKLNPKSKSDAEFLWSVWYNAFIVKKDFTRLKAVLVDLIDKYSNSSRDSERICKFGDKQSLKSVIKIWNCWLNRKLDQSSVKRSRLRAFEDKGYTMSFNDRTISQYASMQIYIDRGIKEPGVKIVGQEMLTAAIDGFVNFSEDRKGRKVFVNPTMMRPGCDEWRVEDGAHAAACYLPLQKEFLDKHSTIHEACFEKMRETIFSYIESWKVTKVTYTFWATDMFHLCHWLLPSDMTFDFIFTSNLMDHVGLLNLLLITQPRLKNLQSILFTESHNWSEIYETLEEFFNKELRCNLMFLPSMIGLRLAEDLTFGTSNLQGFYRTMYGRHSDTESFYWTKSLNQANFLIDFEGSPDLQEALFLLLVSTFWSQVTAKAASSMRQTPLALMYCFQRLQHLFRGGMTELLEYIEFTVNRRSLDFSRNGITWDVVTWAFGLKHERDQLYIVKIQLKDVNSRLVAIKKYGNLICRLRLDYNNSCKTEILSLFQYDAIGQHFEFPILESAWNALPENSTISIIDSDREVSLSLPPGLRNEKIPVKIVGKVTAIYNQPKQTDPATTNSISLVRTCFEDNDKYRLASADGTEAIAPFNFFCKSIVSGYKNNLGLESTAPYRFSCAVDSYEIKAVDNNRIQPILYKMKHFNLGGTALPYRLIADCELLPFTSGQDIKNYLEETMICDLMFCSPTDIESRAKALKGQDLLTDDAFLVLRLVIEHLWQIGSQKYKTLQHTLQLEIREPRETSKVLILDIEGYYKYNGLPLVRMRYMELNRSSAALNTTKETTTIYAKDRKCLELLKKLLFTNSLRMPQESSASVTMTASSSQSLNTFLQMVFRKESGEVMALALHQYPSITSSAKNYIDKIYSASIRENFVSRVKAMRIKNKQMNALMLSISTNKVAQFPSGKHTPDAKMTKSSSSSSLKQQTSCAECKKPTADLKKCSRCMAVAYCSKECQLKDWPNHKKMCSSGNLKAEKSSTTVKGVSDESGCSRKPKKTSGSSMQPRMEDCATKESRVNDVSSAKEIEENENDLLAETKIEGCSTENSNSEGGSSAKPMSKDNIEDRSEIGSSIKADSHSQPHLQEPKSNDGNAAVTDNSVISKSVELCMHCRLEKTNMKKCTKCKSAAYCRRECQRADWKRHKPECQTQELPSAAPLMNRCNSCGVVGKEMKKCSQCKAVSYCSIECQRKDWKSHKTTCRQP